MKILFLLLLTINAFADDCTNKAKKHGSHFDAVLTADCLNKADKQSGEYQKQTSEDGQWMSIGNGAILIARRLLPVNEQRDNVIAGSYTQLENITSTAIDSAHKEIYAYDSVKNSISVFNATLPGNVGPLRTFTNDALSGTTAILVDGAHGVLITISKKAITTYDTQNFKSVATMTIAGENFPHVKYTPSTGTLFLSGIGTQTLTIQVSDSGKLR